MKQPNRETFAYHFTRDSWRWSLITGRRNGLMRFPFIIKSKKAFFLHSFCKIFISGFSIWTAQKKKKKKKREIFAFFVKIQLPWYLKDVRANCFCASLPHAQIHTPGHASMRALSNNINNDRADDHCYSFAWIFNDLERSVTPFVLWWIIFSTDFPRLAKTWRKSIN